MTLMGPCGQCKKLTQIQLGVYLSPDRVQVMNHQTGQPMVFDVEQYAQQILMNKGTITCGECNARKNYTNA